MFSIPHHHLIVEFHFYNKIEWALFAQRHVVDFCAAIHLLLVIGCVKMKSFFLHRSSDDVLLPKAVRSRWLHVIRLTSKQSQRMTWKCQQEKSCEAAHKFWYKIISTVCDDNENSCIRTLWHIIEMFRVQRVWPFGKSGRKGVLSMDGSGNGSEMQSTLKSLRATSKPNKSWQLRIRRRMTQMHLISSTANWRLTSQLPTICQWIRVGAIQKHW